MHVVPHTLGKLSSLFRTGMCFPSSKAGYYEDMMCRSLNRFPISESCSVERKALVCVSCYEASLFHRILPLTKTF